MKNLWKKQKLLVIGVPGILVIMAVVAIMYLQHGRNVKIADNLEAGEHYLSELNYEQAIASYQQALDIDAKNRKANLGLAAAYDANQMAAYAEAVYKGMLEQDSAQTDVYGKLADLYMREGELDKAKELLETAHAQSDDEEITELYYVTRPEVPTMSYESGEYQERIRVDIIPSGEHQKIYFTLDGTQPTQESEEYDEPLILFNGKTTIKAMVVNDAGYQSDIAVSEYNVKVNNVRVELEEPLIERIIREKLDIPYDRPIYNEDIEQITELYIVGGNLYASEDVYHVLLEREQYILDGNTYAVYAQGQISTLNDLQYMPFLERVAVEYQPGLDISILGKCGSIRELSLMGDNLTSRDITALSGMANLERLNLGWNQIQDVKALSGLTNLTSLGIWGNQLKSIEAINGLKNLTYLDFSDNQVTDLAPLAGLQDLKELWMYQNRVQDISIVEQLPKLQVLMLRDNPLQNPEAVRSVYPQLTRIDADLLNLGGKGE